MIKHIVMWRLRGPAEEQRREQAEQVRAALLGLRGEVPGMSSLEVGIGAPGDEQRADVVLISTHDDWAALQSYLDHPLHVAVAQVVAAVRIERRVLDFVVEAPGV